MSELLDALINRRSPVDLDMCRAFWDQLDRRTLQPGEAAALLACLSTSMPSARTVQTLVRSLNERRPEPASSFMARSTSSVPAEVHARSISPPQPRSSRPQWVYRW